MVYEKCKCDVCETRQTPLAKPNSTSETRNGGDHFYDAS